MEYSLIFEISQVEILFTVGKILSDHLFIIICYGVVEG